MQCHAIRLSDWLGSHLRENRRHLTGDILRPYSGVSTLTSLSGHFSLTDATSKVGKSVVEFLKPTRLIWKLGNFPFTTIDPQRAIGYLQIQCACARYDLSDRCKPNYGSCVQGKRSVPIELLDVAGLVPGAHEGKGLGNRFLDDLRHADALVHVVDVSGTTDAEGEIPVTTKKKKLGKRAGLCLLTVLERRKGHPRL